MQGLQTDPVQYYTYGTIIIRILRHGPGITSTIAIVFLVNDTNTNTNTDTNADTNADTDTELCRRGFDRPDMPFNTELVQMELDLLCIRLIVVDTATTP